jgi:Flp pilus assembly protein TadG
VTSGTTEELGQATVLVLGLSLVVFAIAGLAVDGTRAFLLRRSLQNSADAAALAAAAELDEAAYYASGGKVAVLDEPAARRSAADWLQSRGLPLKAEVATAPDRVEVVVRAVVPTTFLGLAGITEIPVAARADASPIAGGP